MHTLIHKLLLLLALAVAPLCVAAYDDTRITADGTTVVAPADESDIDPAILAKAKAWKARRGTKRGRKNAIQGAIPPKVIKVGAGTKYADINAAMEASEVTDGVQLQVQPGTVMTADQTIYKSVEIVGPGWKLNSSGTLADGAATFLCNVMVMAEDVSITGMVFKNGGLPIKPSDTYLYLMDENTLVDHCHISNSRITVRNNYAAYDVTLTRNFIKCPVDGNSRDSNDGWNIHHNIITCESGSVVWRLHGATIDHNTIFRENAYDRYVLLGLEHCAISNNVITCFSSDKQPWKESVFDNFSTYASAANTFTRNVSTGPAPAANNKGGITSLAEVYDFSGDFQEWNDQHYRIKAGGPAAGYATDGTDCGPWGGTTPYEGGGGEPAVTPMSGKEFILDAKHADGIDGTTTYYQTLLSLFTDIDTRGIDPDMGVDIRVTPATFSFAINAETLPLLTSLWQKRNTFIRGSEYKLISLYGIQSGGVFDFMGVDVDQTRTYVQELMECISLTNITLLFNGQPLYEQPKQPVTEAQYTLTLPPAEVEYDGQPHGATVTVAEGVGTPKIEYGIFEGFMHSVPYYSYFESAPTEVGTYYVFLSIAEGELYEAMPRTFVRSFKIVEPKPQLVLGDANTDGSVNILDAQWTLRYILAPAETTPFSFDNANTFATDQLINVQDIVCTVNIILGKSSSLADVAVIPDLPYLYSANVKAASSSVVGGITADSSPAATLAATPAAITLTAPAATSVAAIDIELQGVAPEQLSLALPMSDYLLATRPTATGTRAIILSTTGTPLAEAGTEATILLTSALATPTAALAATPMAKPLAVGIDAATAITAPATAAPTTATPLYDLGGRRLRQPRTGINIVGGRKVLTK